MLEEAEPEPVAEAVIVAAEPATAEVVPEAVAVVAEEAEPEPVTEPVVVSGRARDCGSGPGSCRRGGGGG